MKHINTSFTSSLLLAACLGLSSCDKSTPSADNQPTYQAIAAKVSVGEKSVDSVVLYNTKTGEARLLNAASFADKATGQQGNIIGWVPLVDLRQAVQNLASQIQSQKAAAAPSPAPTATPADK